MLNVQLCAVTGPTAVLRSAAAVTAPHNAACCNLLRRCGNMQLCPAFVRTGGGQRGGSACVCAALQDVNCGTVTSRCGGLHSLAERNVRCGSAGRFLRVSLRATKVPHLHWDWARPGHICTGTGLAPATSAPGPGSPLPHLRRDPARAAARQCRPTQPIAVHRRAPRVSRRRRRPPPHFARHSLSHAAAFGARVPRELISAREAQGHLRRMACRPRSRCAKCARSRRPRRCRCSGPCPPRAVGPANSG